MNFQVSGTFLYLWHMANDFISRRKERALWLVVSLMTVPKAGLDNA